MTTSRVLGRLGARELTEEEIQRVSGRSGTNCTFQVTHIRNIIDDLVDDCFN
jgi:hypothetical protein